MVKQRFLTNIGGHHWHLAATKQTNHCHLALGKNKIAITVFPLNIPHGGAFFDHLPGWGSFRGS
jgi:hypothetical protein